MVRPSNPKLMSRVLEAVTHLGDSKGSSVRDILQLVKKGSNGHTRNVTMQVRSRKYKLIFYGYYDTKLIFRIFNSFLKIV